MNPATATDRIKLSQNSLFKLLREQVAQMTDNFNRAVLNPSILSFPKVDRARSASLPVDDLSVDAVISSPPYCTRIDYVKKTSPELALLGASTLDDFKHLRDQMIGTPTINPILPEQQKTWGKACLVLLELISDHESYASKSYYWKTYLQYFHGLHQSLHEINRTLKPNGKCVLVVQDSYYKDVHVDLAKVVQQMARGLGWSEIGRFDFPTARTIVGLNKHARKNGNPKRATETVLAFRKHG